MKLHKKTLKWAARQMDAAAEECELAATRWKWDTNAIASRDECRSRAYVFRRIAKRIRKGKPAS